MKSNTIVFSVGLYKVLYLLHIDDDDDEDVSCNKNFGLFVFPAVFLTF